MNENHLCVAYSSDDNYVKFLGISMLSLLKNNQDFDSITVYVLDCGIREENRMLLQELAESLKGTISFLPMLSAIEQLQLEQGAHKIAAASYARLFLACVLPQDCDRVLYIDCDTLVRHSLKDLWRTDLGQALIAGCQDTVDSYFLRQIRLPKGVPYLNAGVLLINIKAWREENLLASFRQIIADFNGNVPHHDQGTINAVCGERRIRMPVTYNLFSNLYSFPARTIRRMYGLDEYYDQRELDSAIADPAIVHFTSGLVGRPWEENCTHPLRDEFWYTVEQSPWKGLAIQPDSRKTGLKLFIQFYKITPKPLFEFIYRCMNWALHLRK